MAKLTLSDVSNLLGNPTSAANTINANNALIESALENTFSRDGDSPNQLQNDLDMNHNDIINVDNIHADVLVLGGKTVTTTDLSALPDTVMLKTTYDPQGKNSDAFNSSNTDFIQVGVGAVERSVQTKLRETLSVKDFGAVGDGVTSDQTALVNAVATAFATGDTLYWPDGTYLSEASIPNLHDVEHYGPGVIQRGSNLWYITPDDFSVTNHVYANVTTGSASNDGLTPSQPVNTFQAAIDILEKWTPLDDGQWQINLAAGVYARGRFPDEGMHTAYPVRVVGADVGGHPNVPTTIIREGATQSAFGILAQYHSIFVQDIKVEDYNGSTSSAGIRVDDGNLQTQNVHFEDCYYGASVFNFGVIDIKGGIFNDCGYLNSDPAQGSGHAIRGVFHTKWEVGTQNAGTLANGPFIRNCAGAARAQEYADGHWDYVTVEDCTNGVRLLVNSRLNIDGASFKRVTGSAVYATQGSYVDPTSNTIFGTGADANGRNYSMGSASNASTGGIQTFNLGNAAGYQVLKTSFPNQTINTTVNTLIDLITVDHDALNDTQFTGIACKKVRVTVTGEVNGTTGTFKRLILRLGASLAGGTVTLLSFSTSATGPFRASYDVWLTGPNAQYVSGTSSHPSSEPESNTSSTESTAGDLIVSLEAVMNNAADNIVVEAVEWEVLGF